MRHAMLLVIGVLAIMFVASVLGEDSTDQLVQDMTLLDQFNRLFENIGL